MIKVYVLSFDGGVLAVFKSLKRANQERREYARADYKGLKVEVFHVWE